MQGISDIPRVGKKINTNQPICSIFLKEDTKEKAIKKLFSKAEKIKKFLYEN